MRGRPNLYTSYESETSMLPTWTQRVSMALLATAFVLLPFSLPVIDQLPLIRFLGDDAWIRLTTQAVIFAIAALGLNLLTGVAGQISLGHAFFMGAGACGAVYLGGESGSTTWGHELPIWLWLPGAGVTAMLIGMLVAPAAVRVRGLYLAIATVGLVFIGLHLGRVLPEIAGPQEVGRSYPALEFRFWREEDPLISFADDGHWLWFDISGSAKTYLFCLALLAIAIVVSKNVIRSRTGRAFQAIRDRDVAAEVMGVPETKYKLMAFAMSSFFAGVAGALFASLIGQVPSETWNLLLSVEFVAILLIGGAGTTAGTLLGTFFVLISPRLIENFAEWLGNRAGSGGPLGQLADGLVATGGGDFGLISTQQVAPGFPLPASQLDALFYGLLVVIFLLFEPLGLYGIWLKFRNYWKGWPFTY